MPRNLLIHINEDLNEIKNTIETQTQSVNTVNNNEINTQLISLLQSENLTTLKTQKINKDLNVNYELDFINKGRVVNRDELDLENKSYKVHNYNEFNVNSDNYNAETSTFTSSTNTEYQVMDFDLNYKTYILVTKNSPPEKYLLSQKKNIISTFLEKKLYDNGEVDIHFLLHKAIGDQVPLEVKLYNRKGVNSSVLKKTFDTITVGPNTGSYTFSLDNLVSGSYYIKIDPTNGDIEILNNNLYIENADDEVISSNTFIVKNNQQKDIDIGNNSPTLILAKTIL